MNLNDALNRIGQFLGLPVDALIAYAREDDIGGYHDGFPPSYWPCGSLWEAEGQALYALTRALRPAHVLELGVHVGCSTSHLRRAVQKNGYGFVLSVDKWEGAGHMVDDTLGGVGTLHYRHAEDYLLDVPDGTIGLLFEDLCHEHREVERILTLAKPKLAKGAVIVHHDSEHGAEGDEVRRGIEAAGVTDYLSMAFGGSDCGIVLYRMGAR